MKRFGYVRQLALSAALASAVVPSGGSADSQAESPPGFTTARTGDPHDFEYLIGAWATQQRRLKARDIGSSEWVDAPANRHCAVSYLDGKAVVEESRLPGNAAAGLFVYAFNSQKRQWSIYWVSGKTGQMDPPLAGGFVGTRGEFYGEDEDNGRPIKVRVIWTVTDRDHARWEQSFSYDNRTWETNWISDYTRRDPGRICAGGGAR